MGLTGRKCQRALTGIANARKRRLGNNVLCAMANSWEISVRGNCNDVGARGGGGVGRYAVERRYNCNAQPGRWKTVVQEAGTPSFICLRTRLLLASLGNNTPSEDSGYCVVFPATLSRC